MTIICETSAIFNSCYAAIDSIEIAACYDTCFVGPTTPTKYQEKEMNNEKQNKKKQAINLRNFIKWLSTIKVKRIKKEEQNININILMHTKRQSISHFFDVTLS